MSTLGSFFDRLIGKPKYVPPLGDGTVYGNWSCGDLAVCVGKSTWTEWETGNIGIQQPTNGRVYRVSGVAFAYGFHVLKLEEYGPEVWFTAGSFRKAVIDKAEAGEFDFRKLLQDSTELV